MKIQKGHYVPKGLITSETVHEAVVRVFVAAGFKDERPNFGNIGGICEGDDGLGIYNGDDEPIIMWGIKGDSVDEPITLQQLFTAENGLQWPDWAKSICTNRESVYFCNDVKFSFIVGSSFGGDVELLVTRKSKQKEMKTIKDAVELFKNWPDGAVYLVAGVNCGRIEVIRFGSVKADVAYPESWKYLCNKDEFESTAKLMGYINGYRWGVEYPTNGKRPDLPDDVWVMVCDCCQQDVGAINWSEETKFKITDRNLKPADTSYLKPVIEISESKPDTNARKTIQTACRNLVTQFMQDNLDMEKAKRKFIDKCLLVFDENKSFSADGFASALFNAGAEFKDQSLTHSEEGLTHSEWHERGELPPVGSVCEYKFANPRFGWSKVSVDYIGKSIIVVTAAIDEDEVVLDLDDVNLIKKFRPIRTERDQFVEQARDKLLGDTPHKETAELLGQLYDLGYRLPVEK